MKCAAAQSSNNRNLKKGLLLVRRYRQIRNFKKLISLRRLGYFSTQMSNKTEDPQEFYAPAESLA